jgi:hypothetical protein
MSNLQRVEKHAAALESCAAAMEAEEIGAHLTHGHAMAVRKIAAHPRSCAASGQLPSMYRESDSGFVHAVAAPAEFSAETAAILDQLR